MLSYEETFEKLFNQFMDEVVCEYSNEFIRTPKSQEIQSKIDLLLNRIRKSLPQECLKDFDKLDEHYALLNANQMLNAYKQGFRDGIRLMLKMTQNSSI